MVKGEKPSGEFFLEFLSLFIIDRIPAGGKETVDIVGRGPLPVRVSAAGHFVGALELKLHANVSLNSSAMARGVLTRSPSALRKTEILLDSRNFELTNEKNFLVFPDKIIFFSCILRASKSEALIRNDTAL